MLPQNPNLFAKELQRVTLVLQHAVISVRDSLLQDNDRHVLLALIASYSLPLPQKLTSFLMVLQAEFEVSDVLQHFETSPGVLHVDAAQ